jgi:serine/threonine-protein kinase
MGASFQAGSIIAQRYRLVDRIGSGAMGEVWRAEHQTLKSMFALKLIDPKLLVDGGPDKAELFERFEREAQASARLSSVHVVKVVDHGFEHGVPYIAMELLVGETLADRLERVGTLTPAEAATLVVHVCRAMQDAHDAGIVHRDLKPENVFLVKNGDEEIAKVLDFGIAKFTRSALDIGLKATSTGQLLGTPCYMSPEQASGQPLDHRSDLWAIAVMAYECLVGDLPFVSNNLGDLILTICTRPLPVPSQANPGLPPSVDAWWARASERDPAKRFQSARDLADALKAALAGGAPGLPPGPNAVRQIAPAMQSTQSGLTTHRSRPAVAATSRARYVGAAALSVVVIAAVGFFMVRQLGSSDGPPAVSSEVGAQATGAEVASPKIYPSADASALAVETDGTAPRASASPVDPVSTQPSASSALPREPAPSKSTATGPSKPRPTQSKLGPKPGPTQPGPAGRVSTKPTDPRLGL